MAIRFLTAIATAAAVLALAACATPEQLEAREKARAERAAHAALVEQAKASPEALKQAGLAMVGLYIYSPASSIFGDTELEANVTVGRLGEKFGIEKLVTVSGSLINPGLKPQIAVIKPGDYYLLSFEFGQRFSGSPGFGGLLNEDFVAPIEFSVKPGDIVNLGAFEIIKVVEEEASLFTTAKLTWAGRSHPSSPEVEAAFAEQFPAFAPLAKSRPFACKVCPEPAPEPAEGS